MKGEGDVPVQMAAYRMRGRVISSPRDPSAATDATRRDSPPVPTPPPQPPPHDPLPLFLDHMRHTDLGCASLQDAVSVTLLEKVIVLGVLLAAMAQKDRLR